MNAKTSRPSAVTAVFDDRQKRIIGRAFSMARDALLDCGMNNADVAMAIILFGVSDADREVGTPQVIASLKSLIVALNEQSRGKPESSSLWN